MIRFDSDVVNAKMSLSVLPSVHNFSEKQKMSDEGHAWKHARTFSSQPESMRKDSNGYHRTVRTIVGPELMPSVSRGKH